jgi:NADH:ubiquinone oxidoreductase subunit
VRFNVFSFSSPFFQAVYSKPHKENKTGSQEAYHPHNYVYGPRVKNTTDPNCEEWDPSLPSPFKEHVDLK